MRFLFLVCLLLLLSTVVRGDSTGIAMDIPLDPELSGGSPPSTTGGTGGSSPSSTGGTDGSTSVLDISVTTALKSLRWGFIASSVSSALVGLIAGCILVWCGFRIYHIYQDPLTR